MTWSRRYRYGASPESSIDYVIAAIDVERLSRDQLGGIGRQKGDGELVGPKRDSIEIARWITGNYSCTKF